ncbi:hypothetical protein C8F01DRAFT_1037530, partial [Mycena amicta]
ATTTTLCLFASRPSARYSRPSNQAQRFIGILSTALRRFHQSSPPFDAVFLSQLVSLFGVLVRVTEVLDPLD